MEQEFLRRVAHDEPLEEILAAAGDPDPAEAAPRIARAARCEEITGRHERWLPQLLRTARPGFAAAALLDLAATRRRRGAAPLDLDRVPALLPVLGSSSFLARLLLRDPTALDELEGDPPAAPDEAPAPDWEAIRRAKYRGLLRIAARDLLGRPFALSLKELTELADRCLAAAARAVGEQTGVEAPAVLALGKLGGCELNFSSDVDLVFLYEEPRGDDPLARNAAVARWVRALKSGLECPTESGFVYRVDLDLRPEGPTGVLANSVDAALAYYESFGAEWERQAMIRLRHVTGPLTVSQRFQREIRPFVYRRALSTQVLHRVRAMKNRIEEQRRSAGRDLEFDLKEGPGGIRDLEFLVQALQLFYGGRDPSLRTGNVLAALAALAAAGVMPAPEAELLKEAYLWLRRAEHALQLEDERQVHRVPREAAGQIALARRMGYGDAEGKQARTRLLEEWAAVRAQVRSRFEALVPEGEEA